jgi:hypothetical protein
MDKETIVVIGIAALIIFLLLAMLSVSQPTYQIEGFLTTDKNALIAQRQNLQFEGERRYNDLARVQNPESTVSARDIDSTVRQVIPVPGSGSASLLQNIASSVGLGGQDDGSNKSGAWVEQTGMVQAKINFCESLPVNCDGFTDPRMAECGFCHKGGVNSKGQKWRGGMYVSSDDQIRTNETATASNSVAQYVPTIGKCEPKNFTLAKERCDARENQLECERMSAPANGNRCAQCYGSNGALLFVGAKPQAFTAYLHISHPGLHSSSGVATTITAGSSVYTLPPSAKTVLDPKVVTLTGLKEGDTIRINVLGIPRVWCAWLSNSENIGTRTVGISVGEQSIMPTKGLGIVGDKLSTKVSSELAKASDQTLVAPFRSKVPNNVMWYGRNSNVPGAIISAKYGETSDTAANVLSTIRARAGTNSDIPASSLGTAQANYLWVRMDNGRYFVIADGEVLKKSNFYNNVVIETRCPATLKEPAISDDLASCPSGPLIYTEIGAGLMGANSCYTATGQFDPNVFCLQELFKNAGGTESGTLYPKNTTEAAAMVQKVAGKPDLNATTDYLNNLGNIAIYGQTPDGAIVEWNVFSDASMKMFGRIPANPCDGPNSATGPHTAACLNLLWKTSGDTTTPKESSVYKYCGSSGTKAPTNEDNMAIANDKGGVAEVKAYYKSIYDAANNTSNFNTWSKSMKACYNATVKDTTDASHCKPTVIPRVITPPTCSAPNCVDWSQSRPGQAQPACGERVTIFGKPNFVEYNFSIPVGEWKSINEIHSIPGNNKYTIHGGDGNVSMVFPEGCNLKLTINNGPNFSGPVTLVFMKTCAQSITSGSCGQNDYAALTAGKPWGYAQSIRCERITPTRTCTPTNNENRVTKMGANDPSWITLSGPSCIKKGDVFSVTANGDWTTSASGSPWKLNGVQNTGCRNTGCGFRAPETSGTATVTYNIRGLEGKLDINVV